MPAMLIGIIFGPIAANFLDHTRWGPGSLDESQKSAITLGFMRVMISVQLLIAGYSLPVKYVLTNWKSIIILVLPVMAIMWLCTAACLLATIPNLTLLEEPQAAFYAWIEQGGREWRSLISPGDIVLVCNVGGGTADFRGIQSPERWRLPPVQATGGLWAPLPRG